MRKSITIIGIAMILCAGIAINFNELNTNKLTRNIELSDLGNTAMAWGEEDPDWDDDTSIFSSANDDAETTYIYVSEDDYDELIEEIQDMDDWEDTNYVIYIVE